MSVLTEAEDIAIQNQFQDLLHACIFIRSDEDRNMIRKAFDLSYEAHRDMRRKRVNLILFIRCVWRVSWWKR